MPRFSSMLIHAAGTVYIGRRCDAIVALAFWLSSFLAAIAADEISRPNILWITAEDMSPTLGCYGDEYAINPNIDGLAEQSVRYTHAFATAPVCSPVRSCLITGCYPTSLGTHQMRSAFPIPESMRGFPALLREQGYYTTNNVKTDYNTANAETIIAASWNESSDSAHWRKRADTSKPFFSVFNLMTSHQSRTMVWTQRRFRSNVQSKLSREEIHDPNDAPLPPYYPDTLVTRRIVARFYDCVTAMDKRVGGILKQLDEDGLADNTIVFFYSDHGSGMPRHKRQLHDSGMHIPLLIRFPERYAHLAPVEAGNTTDRLVSFVDFSPTVLELAGVKPPQSMQGNAFLGSNDRAKRKYVYGHRDRIDEAMDLARSVRDKRFLYIRNFMPHLGYNQPTSWPDMGEIRHEFYRLATHDQLPNAIRQFVGTTRPLEELYDCDSDPHNLNNLADSGKHGNVLDRMRAALDQQIRRSRDVGFIPESIAWPLFRDSSGWEFARHENSTDSVGRIHAAYLSANRIGTQDEASALELLNDSRPSSRYWGTVSLINLESISPTAQQRLRAALRDEYAAVRVEAAHALSRHGATEEGLPVLIDALRDEDLNVVLHATRTVELLGSRAKAAEPAMRQVAERSVRLQPSNTAATFVLTREQDLAMFCSFAANGFLKRLKEGPWIDLFDGQSLTSWSGFQPGEAQATGEEIIMRSKGKNVWVVHKQELEDFELTVEASMPAGDDYNAGIGFRCQIDSDGRPKGYQCEVAEELSGMLYAIRSGGWVWPDGEKERKRFFENVGPAFRTGQWNHFRIRCEGSRIQIWLNGILATDILDDKHAKGRIALQHHGKGSAHRYRNVRIRRLNDG